MKTLVGVDAGGSHSEAVVADESLRPIARARGARGAVAPGGAEQAARNIADTIGAALREAGLHAAGTVVVGAAGAGREAERAALEEALRPLLGNETRVTVTTDAAIALEAAFPGRPGILLSAGSGSIGFARDAEGAVWRVGGLGWQFGDDGSGYALGRAALGVVARASDGRGPATTLDRRIHEALAVSSLEELTRWAQTATPPDVAALAQTVCDAAAHGDDAALALVREAARDLGSHVQALVPRLRSQATIPVALAGGLLGPGSVVRRELEAWLAREVRSVRVGAGVVDPVMGAVALAAGIG